MTSDDRLTWNLFFDILGVLEHHGYRRSDNYHIEQVIRVVSDLTRTYEGTHQTRPAPVAPTPPPGPAPPAPEADQDAITLTHAEVSTVFAAADIAADDKRYRIQMCPDCPDQTCSTCQTHLRDAGAFDQIADRMLQAARTAPDAHHGHTEPPRQPGPAADKEAGQ
jgi:hypothetical protein